MVNPKKFNVISAKAEHLLTPTEKTIRDTKNTLLETMDIDSKLSARNKVAFLISEQRNNNGISGKNLGIPEGQVDLGNGKVTINKKLYKDFLDKYANYINSKQPGYEKELERLDSQLAERIILDSGNFVTFSSTEQFADGKSAQDTAKLSYDSLQVVDKYKNKLDLLVKIEGTNTYAIIKWKPQYQKLFDQINQLQPAPTPAPAPAQPQSSINAQIQQTRAIQQTQAVNLTSQLNANPNIRNAINVQSIDNTLLVNRDNLADAIEKARANKTYPDGWVQIKASQRVDLKAHPNDFAFFQQEYQNPANQNKLRLHELDTEFAERIIIQNKPSNSDQICYIQINNDIPGKAVKSEQQLIDEANKCVDGLTNLGYNVEYITVPIDKGQGPVTYHIVRLKEEKPMPEISAEREEISTLSNVTEINRAIADREAGEMLRRRYKKTARYKPWSRPDKVNLFMRRKFIKDRYIHQIMDKRKGMVWGGAETSATDRHEIEKDTNMALGIDTILNDIDDTNYPQARKAIDELILKYLGSVNTRPPYDISSRLIDEKQFKKEFANIIYHKPSLDATSPSLLDLIKDNDITQMGSNSLLKIDAFKEHQRLVWSIADHIDANPAETDAVFSTRCRPLISQYITNQKNHPDFLKQLKINLDDPNSMKDLRNYQKNQHALTMVSAQTLKLKIQILNKGAEAYEVKEKKGIMTKIGNWLDNPLRDSKWLKRHPAMAEAFGRLRGITKVGALVTPGLLLAPLGPLAVATGVGTTSLIKTLFGKYSHYHKEHKDYQKRQAVNVLTNRAERMRLANKVTSMSRMRRNFLYYLGLGENARDVRQYRDYITTTQDQLGSTKQLNEKIKNILNKPALNGIEKTTLEEFVANGLARLDFHKKTGQNFLGSEKENIAEGEYQELYRLVTTGSQRLGQDFTNLRASTYYDTTHKKINNGTGDHPQNQGYALARSRFISRQREKAIIGAVKAGGIAFGLSYLASSLLSKEATTSHVTGKESIHENFALGKHDMANSNAMYNDSLGFFNQPNSAHQTINFSYGGGTDATHVIPGHLTQADYLTKVTEVTNNINSLSHIAPQAKAELLKEIHNQPRLNVQGMTNANLHNMRCLEGLEQAAKALDASTNASTIILHPQYVPSVHDIAGRTINAASERVAQGTLGFEQTITTPASNTGIPVPIVLNTFKEADQRQGRTRPGKNQSTRQPASDQNPQEEFSAGTL